MTSFRRIASASLITNLSKNFPGNTENQAKDEDLSNWLNTLDQGGSREGIYQALTLDEVYNGLESIEEKPTQKLLDYCLMFSQKFVNQTFKTESLQNLNLYSLKRFSRRKVSIFWNTMR